MPFFYAFFITNTIVRRSRTRAIRLVSPDATSIVLEAFPVSLKLKRTGSGF